MKKTILALALALTPSVAFAENPNNTPYTWTAGTPACSVWTGSTWIQCRGSFEGNNEGNGSTPGAPATLAYINGEWGATYGSGGSFIDLGTQSFNNTTNITTFSQVLKGYNVIALKQATRFSLYLFDFGSTGVSQLSYNSMGVVEGQENVSHVTAYKGGEGGGGGQCTNPGGCVVPEPNSYILMASGLAGLGFLARRRRKNA